MTSSNQKSKKKDLVLIFGKVLKELRNERNLSQEKLGFKSGYHRTYISLIERGNRAPTLKTIFNLATALNISATEMIKRVQQNIEKQD